MHSIRTNATLEAELITAWEASHTGPLVTIGTDHVSYSRIPENASIFSQFEDPASGKNSPHLEISIAVSVSKSMCEDGTFS